MQSRSRFPVLLLAAIGAAVVGFGLVFLLSAPSVGSVSPGMGAGRVSALAPVQIVFDQPMEPGATGAALSLEPSHPGRVVWPDARTLRFVPAVEWPRGVPVEVALGSGARSARGLPLLRRPTWTFQVDAARVAYLQLEPEGAASNIWSVLLDGTAAQRITDEPLGVNEFDASPDGTRLAYSAPRADGGADLKEVVLGTLEVRDLLACPGEACRAPAYSPDGDRLGFERRELSGDGLGDGVLATTEVWMLDLRTGAAGQVPTGSGEVVHTPTWVPTGSLSFVDETLQAIGWYEPETGTLDYAPDFAVEMGAWSPDGSWLVYSEILLPEHADDHAGEAIPATPTPDQTETAPPEPTVSPEDVFYTHLLRYSPASGQLVELTDAQLVEDTSPAYSPSGQYLAFARKFLEADRWTPGRQLWVMRADGGEARQLTDDGIFNHAAFVWSPDEQMIVYMRFNVADFNAPPEIWAAGLDDTEPRQLAARGALPRWLP